MRRLRHALLLCLAAPAAADPSLVIGPGDFTPQDPARVALGRLLFHDPLLSGNRNIACATCHHPTLGSADGVSLGIGEGGMGLGRERTGGTGAQAVRKRVPRNAPALWNLGHRDVEVLFHDGRLSVSDLYANGFDSPAEEWLPDGLTSILAAQALFPLSAQFEMAGNVGENDVTGAVHDRIDGGWPIVAARVAAVPGYVELFADAYADVDSPADIDITHVAEALGAFVDANHRSYDSPFDRYLAGQPLPPQAEAGRALFYGDAGCADCHSGPLMTDQDFHALGLPAFGPGRTRTFDQVPRDVGRMGVTDLTADAYRFRTPPLRNVALTGPWGHNGAWPTLADAIRHHADPEGARAAWAPDMAALPDIPWLSPGDFAVQADRFEMARQAARPLDIAPVALTEAEIAQLEAFLHALTGDGARDPAPAPESVPSGLPVD
ncbi:MAG: cytochrome-c peroxidase [Paracoccaceae bacterium]